MFILGLISASVGLSYMGLTIYSFQTNKFENVKHLKNNKWIIWIISLGSTILLLISTYQVFYNLQHKVFSQTVGFDQGSYQNAYAPFIFLGFLAIVMNWVSEFINHIYPRQKPRIIKG